MGNRTSKTFLNKRLDGKTALVTGSNTGIGKVTAKELYRLGARVIMACRNTTNAEAAMAEIKSSVGNQEEKVGELVIKSLDLSSLASIKKCAEEINSEEGSLNLLINNAGVMMCSHSYTEDGFETHFGVNHLGHFLFTCLLLPKIIKSAPARIINVSSAIYKRGEMNWEDLNYKQRRYSALNAYAQSKLANVLFTIELAEKLKDKNVVAYSLHPGVVKTDLGRHLDETYFNGARLLAGFVLSPIYKTPEQGALTTLYCALKDSDEFSGGYFSDCKLEQRFEILVEKFREQSQKLWEISSKLVNYDFSFE